MKIDALDAPFCSFSDKIKEDYFPFILFIFLKSSALPNIVYGIIFPFSSNFGPTPKVWSFKFSNFFDLVRSY